MLEERKNVVKTDAKTVEAKGGINIDGRRKATVSGVRDVDSFDEQSVSLFTELGPLMVKGTDLRISKLSVDSGDVIIEGDIASAVYTEQHGKSGEGFLKKLFK